MALIDKVANLIDLRQYEIISTTTDDKIDTLVSDAVIIAINKHEKTVHISFEVSMKADEAAIFGVNIVNLNPKFKYIMNPCFMIDEKGDVLCGSEAYKYYSQKMGESVIESFLNEQKVLHMLHHMKPSGTA